MKLFHHDPEPKPVEPEKGQEDLELTEDQLDDVSGGRGGHHEPPSPNKP